MGVRSISDLEAAFRHRIIPLLEEYFYGDWEKIQLVFGDLIDERDSDSRPRAHAQCIVSHVIERPNDVLNIRDDSYETLRSYDISDELSPQSFRKIYE
jgi:5-methylcytosine-specific restriction protein B